MSTQPERTRATIRAATERDDEGIRALLADCFPDNIKAQAPFMRWQYWDNPFAEVRSWLAEADGQVVCHWAAVPVPMVLDGRTTVGAKGVDGATRPEYRGLGLFAGVGAAMVEDCGTHGVEVILTHPNPDAAPGAERAGAVLVDRAAVFVAPLDDDWLAGRLHAPAPIARLVRRAAFRRRRGDAPEVLDAPPEGIDGLWETVGRSTRNGIARHGAWWQWRYADRPERPYRFAAVHRGGSLAGAGAVTVQKRYGGRFGLVLELLAVDEQAARGVGEGLAAAAAEEGAVGLALATLPRSRMAALARAAGFRRLPERLEPRPLRFMVFDPAGDAAGLAARPWSMAWGDLDHF